MKTLLTTLLLIKLALFASIAKATTYYFSTSSGDDSRTAAQAQNPATPWKTINKLNSIFSTLQPGDVVLFNRGEIFYGAIVINKSGTAGSPIVLGAYGSGAKPVITGFTTVNTWTNLGGNIWESSNAVSSLSSCNMVVINGVNIPLGRWPNTGYRTITSGGSSSLSDNTLSSPNWTGAEVVIRKNHWVLDRCPVTSHSGTTLNFTNPDSYPAIAGYGYFIQNHPSTLDQQGEWYFDPSSKKIRIYSTSSPVNVQVSTIDRLVYLAVKNYITFDNLSLQGSNDETFYVGGAAGITIQNCDMDFAGKNCIWGGNNWGSPSSNFKLQNNTINHTNNNAIQLADEFSNAYIGYNNIHNTAIIAGMGQSQDGQYFVLHTWHTSNLIVEHNTIDYAGYVGLSVNGSSTIIRNNFINNFCLVKDDGGGIYMYDEQSPGKQVMNNIVLNGMGAGSGTADGQSSANGIYMDDNTANVEIAGNTVANCALSGLFLHNATNINIHNNTFYNNNITPAPLGAQLLMNSDGGGSLIRSITMNSNIFFSKTASQYCACFTSTGTDIPSFGAFDNNYYARPIDDNLTFHTFENGYSTENHRTLAGWKPFSGKDINSLQAPKTISTVNDLRFEYNATASNKTINLGATYMDVTGKSYSGSITLAPYTSAVLIYQSGAIANQPPIADAGSAQVILLPVSLAVLNGSGSSDPDGSISSYQWSKISGPTQFTIATPTQAQTAVNSLVQGTYQFELKVTDNSGGIGRDTVQVIVNAAPNQSPSANAGTDKTITLPTNSVTVTGIGTDPDGTIAIYQWAKISGPSQFIIATPAQLQTLISGLIQGTYQFQLTVTDNLGATAKDTINITVNAAPNQFPVANTGADKTITLPTNTVTLTGSGTDADGTISSYQWSKVLGPSQFAIASSAQAQTVINNLVQGVYQFELKVTDNLGATGKDTVIVTVNPAPSINQPPVSNAGIDISITLPVNTATLTGIGTDADGTIATYRWTMVGGPAQFTIASRNLSQTGISNLIQGIYHFELQITDNLGSTDTDTVIVTVNAAPNQPPIANTGSDKTITLPTNTVTVTGSGTDADGTIASYQWSKVSGPSQFAIAAATQAQSAINNLIQGVYQFELKVTDNQGATGRDTILVIVNAAPPPPSNQSPVANAGSDISITLPTNSTALTGSGADADGSITTYRWTKVAGPSQFTIASRNLSQTGISNLTQGIYQFELQVTDNLGATDTDTVIVTINAAPNQSPVANTGTDKTITLPTNTVTVTGSGTDADGTIASYQWSKVSGPSQFTIATATQAQSAINNLIQGFYQFELKVTDNQGAIARDTILVTVNAAPPPPSNQTPAANAGNDISITLPTNTTTLTGSGTDADGSITTYRWTKVAGPAQFIITSRSQAQTTITNLVQGIYQFELQVTDNLGATDTDTVIVTVNAAPNQPPVANTGTDKTITLPTNAVTVTGSGTDADGTIASYQWSKVSGPSQFAIATATQAQSAINNLIQGVYQFELKVTDNQGAIGRDTILVTVNAAPPPPSNQSPAVNAGNDISITLPTNSTTLTGSGTDADGSISSYRWTKVAGPTQFRITSRSSAQTTITNLAEGVYQFELLVTDNQGAAGKDTVTVTVNPGAPASNKKPSGNAGSDKKVTLPTNSTTLSGSGADPDGTITSYQWSQVSGPAQSSIATATQEQTTINSLVPGVYLFEFKVIDDQGEIAADTVVITVLAAPNQSPSANAGNNITISLPTNTTTLNGSGTDPDGTIVSYRWTMVGGPSQFGISARSQAQTDIYNLTQGVYQFELVVTDDLGATGKDTVAVTVNAAPNQPPVANAGFDNNITLPVNTVNLVGIGADADGTIISYQWTKISGPSQFTIVSPTQPQTVVNNLVQGTYQFELTVTDNRGGIAKDIVIVIVNPAPPPPNQAPVANAGSDKTIALPINTVTLNGSGTDADGTVGSYQWTKVSGPAQFTIISPAQGQTTINNLVEGVYQFELTVTDNKGATGKDIVTVTVNPVPNQAPVANAGSDKMISLPLNSITVTGSGTDADGTIASFQWTEIAGHPQVTIATATQAQTMIADLIEGVYRFELRVTDNKGAIGRDTMQITVVKPASNISFAIYPNPVATTLNVKLDAISQPTPSGIHIFDSRGTLIYKEQFTRSPLPSYKQINLTKYPNGIYFIEIGDDYSRQRLKFVKQ